MEPDQIKEMGFLTDAVAKKFEVTKNFGSGL
jgi:hypothetical protein